MNLRQLILSQPKLLAGGAATALVVGLGFGWLAREPIDAAFARPSAIAPNLTIDASGGTTAQQAALDAPAPRTTTQQVAVDAPAPKADGPAPRLVTAAVYPSGEVFTPPARPQAVRQDPAPVSGDQQWAAYGETPSPRYGPEDREYERAPDYPPPPPPYGYGYGNGYDRGYGYGYRGDDGPQEP